MNKEEVNKKLKNKKKDIISLHDNPSNTPPSNNNSSITTGTIEEKKQEPPSHHYSLEMNQNTSILMDKILFEIQLLFSMTSKCDQKLYQVVTPLLSREHFKNILIERECRNVCGNILCQETIISKSSRKISYNSLLDDFTRDDLDDFFCSDDCFQIVKALTIASENFDYLNLISIDTIFMFSTIQDYYPSNKYLTRIANLAQNLLDEFLRHNKKLELDDYFQRERLRIARKFIDDFDSVLQSSEFKDNEEVKVLFKE